MKIGNNFRIFAGGALALAAIPFVANGEFIIGGTAVACALVLITCAIWGGVDA